MAPKKDNKRKSTSTSDSETSDKETKKNTKDTKEKDTKDTKEKDTKDNTPKKTRQTTKDKTKESKEKEPKKDKKEKKESKSDDGAVTVERGQIDKVLEHLTGSLVKELLDGNAVKKSKANAKKSACIKEILELAAKKGQASLFNALEKDDLKSALETLSKDELDHDNKSKMMIEVKKHFTEMKHKAFFKALPKETLVKFAAALEFEEEDASKEELENALEEEILIAGLRQIFGSMNKEFIVDCAKNLNLPHTGNKKKLENSILSLAYPHLAEEEDEEEEKGKKGKKEKKDGEKTKVDTDISKINKDSSFEDLYQYYTEDLQKFSADNGLKKSGTKKELANRILAWYKDPSAKGLKKGDKEGKKRRKKSESQKKKEAKEKRDKKKEADAGAEKTEKKTPAKKDEKKDDKKEEKKTEEKKGGKGKAK